MIDHRRFRFLVVACLVVVGTQAFYRHFLSDGDNPSRNHSNEPPFLNRSHINTSSSASSSVEINNPIHYSSEPKTSASARRLSEYPIDSRGYAPQIKASMDSNSPSDALRSYYLIEKCDGIQRDIERLLRNRQTSISALERSNITRLIEENLNEQRACQTVDRDILALREKLLIKAVKGGELGAAAILFGAEKAGGKLSLEEQSSFAEQLRKDAVKGHRMSIMLLALMGNMEYGISQEDQLIFRDAFKLLMNEHPDEFLSRNASLRDLVGLYLDTTTDSTAKANIQRREQRVREIVEAHLKLRRERKDS